MTRFTDLGLSETMLEALEDVGYETPSPIQEQAIPPMLEGRDVFGQAQTGSSKTTAFGLPIIEYIDPTKPEVQALVLTPTRELCIQVTQALRTYARRKGADVVAVFGGAPIRTQQAQLKAGGHIVVGTVGRVLDLIRRNSLVLDHCRFVVLDEADEMLDLGFLEDVEEILRLTPNSRQTALFSATMPPTIRKLADNYLDDPVHVTVKSDTRPIDSVEQFHVDVRSANKADKLMEVLEAEKPEQAIVFVRTEIRTDQLYKKMKDYGFNVKALHGDMSQGSRDGVMLGFKGGRVPILVATDAAVRGLDISTVTHVVNFDIPRSPDVYVHRIGRVGRAGRAITFVEPKQEKELEAIERHAGVTIPRWKAGKREESVLVTPYGSRHEQPYITGDADEPFARVVGDAGAARPPAASADETHLARAATVFTRELTGLLGDHVKDVDDAMVGRAARIAAAELAWAKRLNTVLLSASEVALALGTSEQRVAALANGVELLVLPRGDEACFPAWQFAPDLDSAARATLAELHRLYVDTAGASPWSAASWLIAAHPELDGVSPVGWAKLGGDIEVLRRAVLHDAARAAQ